MLHNVSGTAVKQKKTDFIMYSIMPAVGAAGKKQMEVIQLFFRPQKMSHYVIALRNMQ